MERLPDGRERRVERWTAWEETGSYSSSEEYRNVKRREIAERRKSVSAPIETGEDEYYLRQREVRPVPELDGHLVGGGAGGVRLLLP